MTKKSILLQKYAFFYNIVPFTVMRIGEKNLVHEKTLDRYKVKKIFHSFKQSAIYVFDQDIINISR